MSDTAPALLTREPAANTTAPAMASREAVDHRALADQFKCDGFVLLENALPVQLISALRDDYMQLLTAKIQNFKLKRGVGRVGDRCNKASVVEFKPEGGNHDVNRWNMHLPSRRPFLDERLIAHPVVTGILEQLMGEDVYAFLMASDTPYPGADDQTIHRDFPRFGITVNIPLVDFTEDNAPLEIWPGTHQLQPISNPRDFSPDNVPLSELQELTRSVSSRRMLIKAGSILIRDQRLIHRGTAHRGLAPRPCLAIWYKPSTGFAPSRLSIPAPYRSVANWVSRVGRALRVRGRGDGTRVCTKLVNVGNRIGMFTDELARSDRDYRRPISPELFSELSPRAQRMLRFAEVDGGSGDRPTVRRSILGSILLAQLGMAGLALGGVLSVFGKRQ